MNSRLILHTAITLALLALPITGHTQGKEGLFRFEYGMEWGITPNMLYHYHVNYTAEGTGARVNTERTDAIFHVNGQMAAYIGTEIGPKWSAELFSGITGLYDGTTSVPLTMRVTFFPVSRDHKKLKLFAEGGSAFAPCFNNQVPLIVKAGAGTRIMLAKRVSLDFNAALQMYLCHPDNIWDSVNNTMVYASQMRKCDALYAGINLSMSLNFK